MKFKNLIKILLAITITITSANAFKQEDIKPQMTKNINEILLILRDETNTKEAKGQDIVKIIDESFNYRLMARIALGKQWKKLSSDERSNFIHVFETTLKNAYISKLNLYTNQKIEFGEVVADKKRLVLKTQLIGKEDTYKIDYKFYGNKKTKDWTIYDVEILGVSIITTYKKQFAGALREGTYEELLEKLKEKNK